MRALLIVALVGSASASALAQPDEARAEPPSEAVDASVQARALFERGLALSEEGRLAEASELFEQSRALVPRASTALNHAIVLRRLGRDRDALRALDGFDTLADQATEQDRLDAAALRERLRGLLATIRLRVQPTEAEVEVDGRPEPGDGEERTLVLAPGPHVLRVEASGFAPYRLERTLSAGEELSERVTLTALLPERVDPPPELFAPTPEPPPPAGLDELTIGLAIGVPAGVVAMIVAAIAIGVAVSGPNGGTTGTVLDPFGS